ncbi:MAG: autotransporter domain-containing protein [Chlamydiia bacterium]|nr:autotransporter domain-containing protein [Chlamydiia bacterium]
MKRQMNRKMIKHFAFLASFAFAQLLHGEAIIGGIENFTEPYAAVVSSDGVAIRITGETPEPVGAIRSVSMNTSANSIIGGRELSGYPYAARVTVNGLATKITGIPGGTGDILSVGINESGLGIIGGKANVSDPYIALVSLSGVASAVTGAGAPVGEGEIFSVAINDLGVGIAGGRHNGTNDPYAALISPDGVATEISGGGVPVGAGHIYAVAINNSGAGIIGGRDNSDIDTYAAVVSPSGVATEVSGAGAPTGAGEILSVAINDFGTALIGGEDVNVPYAALVAPTGVATPLTGFVTVNFGQINKVDINNSGAGIIGGEHNDHNDPYAALVSPSGVITIITGDVPTGNIEYQTVAISESGVGLLGAYEVGNAFYASIVSPTGVTKKITGEIPQGLNIIYSGDIVDYLKFVDPISYGPGNAFANPMVALSANILTNHLSRVPERDPEEETAHLTADVSGRIRQPQGCQRADYALWAAPFGLFATQDKGHSFPKMKEWSVGGMVGFDYLGWDQVVLGGGAAYSYQDVDYKNVGGYAEIHQELLTVYAAWRGNHISIDGALWGGIYQMHNKRKTLKTINSTSNVDGGIFSPHVRIGAPFKINKTVLTIEPYAMFDWINNWQGSIKEKGSGQLNIRMDSHYVSLLRSEVGRNLAQHLRYAHGALTFEESASYVNRAPFNAAKKSAYYVGSVSTFSVQLFSDRVENLGALRLSGRYVPCNIRFPYVSVCYLGEFGANLMVNTFALEVGKRF